MPFVYFLLWSIYLNLWMFTFGLFSNWILLSLFVLVAQSCQILWDPMDCSPLGISVHRIYRWGRLPFTSPGALPGLNPSLLTCRQILYHLSHQERFLHSRYIKYVIYKYFLETCELSFHSLNEKAEILLKKQKFLMLMNSSSKISFFWIVLLVLHLRNLCLSQGSKNFLLSKSLIFYFLHLGMWLICT